MLGYSPCRWRLFIGCSKVEAPANGSLVLALPLGAPGQYPSVTGAKVSIVLGLRDRPSHRHTRNGDLFKAHTAPEVLASAHRLRVRLPNSSKIDTANPSVAYGPDRRPSSILRGRRLFVGDKHFPLWREASGRPYSGRAAVAPTSCCYP